MMFNRKTEPTSTELDNFYTLLTNKNIDINGILNLAEWCQNDTNIYYLIALTTCKEALPYLEKLSVTELHTSIITRGLNAEQKEKYKHTLDFILHALLCLPTETTENPYINSLSTYNNICNVYSDMNYQTYYPEYYQRLTSTLPLNWDTFVNSSRLIGFTHAYLFHQFSPDYQLLKRHFNLRYRDWVLDGKDIKDKQIYLPNYLVRKLESMELVMKQKIPTTTNSLVLYLNDDLTWPAYVSMRQIKDILTHESNCKSSQNETGKLSKTDAESLFGCMSIK